MSPDAPYVFWVLDGPHRNVTMFSENCCGKWMSMRLLSTSTHGFGSTPAAFQRGCGAAALECASNDPANAGAAMTRARRALARTLPSATAIDGGGRACPEWH